MAGYTRREMHYWCAIQLTSRLYSDICTFPDTTHLKSVTKVHAFNKVKRLKSSIWDIVTVIVMHTGDCCDCN